MLQTAGVALVASGCCWVVESVRVH